MVTCRKCKSSSCVKAGFMRNRQRYKCKQCGYYFIDTPRRGHSLWEQYFATWLFQNGLPQAQIAELFDVSSAAISKWVANFQAQHKHVVLRKRKRIFSLSSFAEATKFFKKTPANKPFSPPLAIIVENFEEDHPIYIYTQQGLKSQQSATSGSRQRKK